jgi:dimethylargininase
LLIALTRPVSATFADCELETLDRQPINVAKAAEQHAAYERCLSELGAQVVPLPELPELPDSVFVEDHAVVVDEAAVLTRMRSETRRREAATIAGALSQYRPLRTLREPATLEGGDVMRARSRLFVGVSSRTNRAGVLQLRAELDPLGYSVHPVAVSGCMHLKTGCCYLGDEVVLANCAWIDISALAGLRILEVAANEPFAANVIVIGGTVLMPSNAPETSAQLSKAGWKVRTLEISELMKAEAGLTCMSILFSA